MHANSHHILTYCTFKNSRSAAVPRANSDSKACHVRVFCEPASLLQVQCIDFRTAQTAKSYYSKMSRHLWNNELQLWTSTPSVFDKLIKCK